MSEGYRNCLPQEILPGTVWGLEQSVGALRVAFGGPAGTEQTWGAPFRRITSARTGHVQFSRYAVELDGHKLVFDDAISPLTEAPDGDR